MKSGLCPIGANSGCCPIGTNLDGCPKGINSGHCPLSFFFWRNKFRFVCLSSEEHIFESLSPGARIEIVCVFFPKGRHSSHLKKEQIPDTLPKGTNSGHVPKTNKSG